MATTPDQIAAVFLGRQAREELARAGLAVPALPSELTVFPVIHVPKLSLYARVVYLHAAGVVAARHDWGDFRWIARRNAEAPYRRFHTWQEAMDHFFSGSDE